MLTREQMKKITGGYGYGYDDCYLTCFREHTSIIVWQGYVCGINTGELHKHCQYNALPYYWEFTAIGTTCGANTNNPDPAICGSYEGY